ncbi:hypothetical protein H8356DRAFT_1325308 [Neocallimastix lanati (nom. inval.)]|nr:hypothetical protein H8356DRAFT_1325308 [Neocallimastix sp. JGI-2020a]
MNSSIPPQGRITLFWGSFEGKPSMNKLGILIIKFIGSDTSGYRLSKDFWKNSKMHLRIFSRFLNNSKSIFYLSNQELPKTNCYIYLGVPFSNDLELKPIIQRMNNKDFLRILIFLFLINEFSYYTPLLGSNKERTRSTQTLVNSRLYWIEGIF